MFDVSLLNIIMFNKYIVVCKFIIFDFLYRLLRDSKKVVVSGEVFLGLRFFELLIIMC